MDRLKKGSTFSSLNRDVCSIEEKRRRRGGEQEDALLLLRGLQFRSGPKIETLIDDLCKFLFLKFQTSNSVCAHSCFRIHFPAEMQSTWAHSRKEKKKTYAIHSNNNNVFVCFFLLLLLFVLYPLLRSTVSTETRPIHGNSTNDRTSLLQSCSCITQQLYIYLVRSSFDETSSRYHYYYSCCYIIIIKKKSFRSFIN